MYKCTSENIRLLKPSDRFSAQNNITVRFPVVHRERLFIKSLLLHKISNQRKSDDQIQLFRVYREAS